MSVALAGRDQHWQAFQVPTRNPSLQTRAQASQLGGPECRITSTGPLGWHLTAAAGARASLPERRLGLGLAVPVSLRVAGPRRYAVQNPFQDFVPRDSNFRVF